MKNETFKHKKHCRWQVHVNRKIKPENAIVVLLFTFFISTASAQEAIVSSGGDGSGGGGSVSYTIGNTVFSTHTGTSGNVAQGVQHPYEIFVVTGIIDEKGIDLILSAYPNPVNDYLILKVETEKFKGMSYQLFNLEGKLIENKKITGTETKISMDSLNPATYLLKIIKNNKESKTFKIIKN